MRPRRRRTTRALLGSVTVLAVLTLGAGPVAATTQEDCGGGDIDFIQAPDDPATIIGARVRDVGSACDGQPVGVQFLGNAPGDPEEPSVELARAYSDEDPCTGADRPDGVLVDGAVEVQLCAGSPTSDHVDGAQLTELRLITTLDAPAAPGGPDTPDGAPDAPGPTPAPAPDPGEGPLPDTGAAIMRSVILGAALVLIGTALVRTTRHAAALRR